VGFLPEMQFNPKSIQLREGTILITYESGSVWEYMPELVFPPNKTKPIEETYQELLSNFSFEKIKKLKSKRIK
jgi:hypothetical protein